MIILSVRWWFLSIFLCFLVSCGESNKANLLTFQPIFLGKTLQCESLLNFGEQVWALQQLQFFIADVQVQTKEGTWHNKAMKSSAYQTNNIALLGVDCSQNNSVGNWQIEFEQAFNNLDYINIRFTLGVPFADNHLNPLKQQSPLNMPSMFWVWRSGHKFLRLEIASDNDNWIFHLGSTGCQSVSPVRAPAEPCMNPNQVLIETKLTPSSTVVFDLSALLNGLSLTQETNCQSEPINEHCQLLFQRIGITGDQRVFGINNAP